MKRCMALWTKIYSPGRTWAGKEAKQTGRWLDWYTKIQNSHHKQIEQSKTGIIRKGKDGTVLSFSIIGSLGGT